MASDGPSKHAKYFSLGDVKTRTRFRKGPCQLFDENRKVLRVLGEGTPILVLYSPVYSPLYKVVLEDGTTGFVRQTYVEKPKMEGIATEELRILATDLVKHGKENVIYCRGKAIPVRTFSVAALLRNSILEGLGNNPCVYSELIANLDDMLRGNSFVWDAGADAEHINNLGKYLNEVIVGYQALNDDTASEVHFPIDPAFAGYDSFIHYHGHGMTPISSKYGIGIASSFLSNIVYPLSERVEDLPECRLKELVQASIDMKDSSSRARSTIYRWGLKYYLNSDFNPDVFFDMLDVGHADDEKLSKMLDDIKVSWQHVPKAMEGFPDTVTSIFCTQLANDINGCKVSRESINSFFRKYPFRQVRLDNEMFLRGQIYFDRSWAWELRLRVERGKMSWSDLRGKQGMLTYRLL